MATVNGCDSIIYFELTVMDGEVMEREYTMCEGDVYQFYTQELTVGGTYEEEITQDGCDATVRLILTVLDIDTTYVDVELALDSLPYTYGDLVYDETTEVGVYYDTLTVENGTDCPDVVFHTLTVIQGEVAVETTRLLDLTIYPNPLAAGATLYVDAEFTAAERYGMVVEVMNMVGQRIISERPTTDDITINGLKQSGVYIVRITTGTGTQYLGKVIVK